MTEESISYFNLPGILIVCAGLNLVETFGKPPLLHRHDVSVSSLVDLANQDNIFLHLRYVSRHASLRPFNWVITKWYVDHHQSSSQDEYR